MRTATRDPNSANPRFWLGKIDARPVSVFRITFCLVLLKVAAYHFPFTDILYTDAGMEPRGLLLSTVRSQRISIMDFLGESWAVNLFWIVWIVILLLLLVGYRARLMSVLSFIFLMSVQQRYDYNLSGADVLMRVISFWMMFIPLAEYYSIDVVRRRWRRYRKSQQIDDVRVETQPRQVFAFPVRALQIQFSMVYLFSGLTKLTGAPWWNGDALYFALSLQTFALPLANWFVASMPYGVLQLMDYMIVVFETLWIFLVFLPFFQPYATVVALVYLGMMHLGIGVMMSIPDFSITMLSVYPLFFKPSWLERIDQAMRAKRERLTVPPPQDPTDPLWLPLSVTSPEEISVESADLDIAIQPGSVLTETGKIRQGQEAFKAIAAHLPLSRFWLWTLRSPAVYRSIEGFLCWWMCRAPLVADYRRSSVQASPSHIHQRFLTFGRVTLVVAECGLLFILFWWNGRTLQINDVNLVQAAVPQFAYPILNYTDLYQSWGMFAPNPSRREGSIIIQGKFGFGSALDLRTQRDPATETDVPHWVVGPDLAWRKIDETIVANRPDAIMQDWAQYYSGNQVG